MSQTRRKEKNHANPRRLRSKIYPWGVSLTKEEFQFQSRDDRDNPRGQFHSYQYILWPNNRKHCCRIDAPHLNLTDGQGNWLPSPILNAPFWIWWLEKHKIKSKAHENPQATKWLMNRAPAKTAVLFWIERCRIYYGRNNKTSTIVTNHFWIHYICFRERAYRIFPW